MMAARAASTPLTLADLLAGIADVPPALVGLPVSSLTLDTRDLAGGAVFVACAGTRHHGLEFVAAAAANGAAAVLGEETVAWPAARMAELATRHGIPVVPVRELSRLAGELAARLYADPSQRLRMFGVTGTNGKTSCAHFIAEALDGDRGCAIVGTLGNGFPGSLEQSTHTTPDPVRLQALLAGFADQGATAVAMEVSSHALHQHRVSGVAFDVALFTNLSRDHLDYHETMEAYGDAKARLFAVPGLGAAVINTDDLFGKRLLATLPAGVRSVAYGLAGDTGQGADFWLRAGRVDIAPEGLRLVVNSSWGRGEVRSGVLGRFNAYNLLAVLGALLVSGVPFEEAVGRVGSVSGVPGRMERFGAPGGPTAVVDYAHTPDALEQVLRAVREHCRGRLVCVFGCGGDRDRGKRPLMGQVAERLADLVVLTDDNPRSEDGGRIIADILSGMSRPGAATVERDRGRAIAGALAEAGAEDWVLVAGKGHETTQRVGDLTLPFSDRERVARFLAGAGT